MELNTRELAILFWVGAFVCLALAYGPSRRQLPRVFRALFHRKIVLAFLAMVAYTVGAIVLASRFGACQDKYLSVTVIWFVTTALALFFKFDKALKERGYFKRIALESISIPVLIAFFVDLYPFGLVAEVLLQALLIVLGGLRAVAPTMKQPGARGVATVLDLLLMGVVLVLLARGAVLLVASWDSHTAPNFLAQLLVPVVLTIVLLPFLYLFTLYAAYEQAFTHMQVGMPDGTTLWRGKVALLVRCGFRLRRVAGLRARARHALARSRTVKDGLRAFDEGLAAEREEREREIAAQERLKRFAGVDGVDDDGRRLDRREFDETKNALRYLAVCQMGHQRNRGGKYRKDLLEVIGTDAFMKSGLPADAGIRMQVTADGRKWWAWRRTVTGWVFGIGAEKEAPDQWEDEGPEPPDEPTRRWVAERDDVSGRADQLVRTLRRWRLYVCGPGDAPHPPMRFPGESCEAAHRTRVFP